MRDKAFDCYSPPHLDKLKHILAVIYTAFGHISENLYLVGGLVPDLLVTNKLPYLKGYLGTLDIDIAIKFAVAERDKYKDFYKIIRSIGFEKQRTGDGSDFMSHSFIKYESGYKPIVVDLITDDKFKPAADKLKVIAPDVEAVKFRGVYLVFKDFIERNIGTDRKRAVKIKIPNIIPFLVLKAFAYSDEINSAAKDAYDIWYTIVNFKDGPVSIKEELLKYKGNKDVADAFKAIHRCFDNESSSGSKDVINILTDRYGLHRPFAAKEVVYPINTLFVK